jgi:hypothetical protein
VGSSRKFRKVRVSPRSATCCFHGPRPRPAAACAASDPPLPKPSMRRLPGQLNVCSSNVYFVPAALERPIVKLPYTRLLSGDASQEDPAPSPEPPDAEEDDQGGRREEATCEKSRDDVPQQRGNGPVPDEAEVSAIDRTRPLVLRSREARLLRRPEEANEAHPDELVLAVTPMYSTAEAIAQEVARLQNADKKERQRMAREHAASFSFDPGMLDKGEEAVKMAAAARITPLCSQPGIAVLTRGRLLWAPAVGGSAPGARPGVARPLGEATAALRRVYRLEDLALEVYFLGSWFDSLLLFFKNSKERDAFQRALEAQAAAALRPQRSLKAWTRDWQLGKVSTFAYLMHLNLAAGRSFNDLAQYPVFPWVLSDYSSPTLDLSDPAAFRDLTRPMGALDAERLKSFKARRRDLAEAAAAGFPAGPKGVKAAPWLYGSHYSTPGDVAGLLLRARPALALRLHNGAFDVPARLFRSVPDLWASASALCTSDVRELVPQFYCGGRGLLEGRPGGSGVAADDATLPAWAADATDFERVAATALEGASTSKGLPAWIDLVFGVKSRGAGAEKADNTFHFLTYDEMQVSIHSFSCS